MYVLKRLTVYVLKRVLFWCLFPEMHNIKGNEHQNNTQLSA